MTAAPDMIFPDDLVRCASTASFLPQEMDGSQQPPAGAHEAEQWLFSHRVPVAVARMFRPERLLQIGAGTGLELAAFLHGHLVAQVVVADSVMPWPVLDRLRCLYPAVCLLPVRVHLRQSPDFWLLPLLRHGLFDMLVLNDPAGVSSAHYWLSAFVRVVRPLGHMVVFPFARRPQLRQVVHDFLQLTRLPSMYIHSLHGFMLLQHGPLLSGTRQLQQRADGNSWFSVARVVP